MNPGRTWWPAIACTCGERHHPGSRYYVSVIERPDMGAESPMILALGPFLTHQEAIAHVDRVRLAVLSRFNPEGRADWYGYGTVAMAGDYSTPGRLNAEI